MTLELNPVAVGNAVVLRAIVAGGWSSRAELAHSVGKDPRNLPRDIGVLAKAGLIADAGGTALTLTAEGRAQLDAIARAEGQTTGGDLLPDERLVVHAQLRPDPDNPRKDFDSDEAQKKLDELRVSIVQDGLLQNLVCRTDPEGIADYIVTAGNRRWHAIQQAIFDADWPEDRPIRIKLREGDAQSSLLTAIVENKQRADMTEIEEAEAFGDLVNVHGMKTIDIAGKTGLSQKVIQNRLKLLRLSDEDKQRMRRPEDHPDHLGYKAALRQLTVTREPEPTLSQQIAEHGTATLATGESGSPDPSPTPSPAASLDRSLTDVEALILAEVVDKAEREPDDLHPDYTAALPQAMKSGVPHLIARGLLGTRQKGMTLLIRPLLHTSGLKQWLEAIGFYDAGRDTVLFELAARVDGAENTADRQSCGVRYATAWLNLEGDPRNDALPEPKLNGTAASLAVMDEFDDRTAFPHGEPTAAVDFEQPELIEATEEEKAVRQAQIEEDRRAKAMFDCLDFLSDRSEDWMKARRAAGLSDYLTDTPGRFSPEDLAVCLVRAFAAGRWEEMTALTAVLVTRIGKLGTRKTLAQMPLDLIARNIADERALIRDSEAA